MHEFELSVGDVLNIDNRIVMVIDIEGEEISLRVDDSPVGNPTHAVCSESVTRPGK